MIFAFLGLHSYDYWTFGVFAIVLILILIVGAWLTD
jgi:hypothetical protein